MDHTKLFSPQVESLGSVFLALYPTDDGELWLPPYEASVSDDFEGCPICYEDSEDTFVQTPCGHVYHGTCLTDWFQEQGHRQGWAECMLTCPMCRKFCAGTIPRYLLVREPEDEDEEEEYEDEAEEEEEESYQIGSNWLDDDRITSDYLAQTMRAEAEADFRHRFSQLDMLQEALEDDEGGFSEEQDWSPELGVYVPAPYVLGNDEDERLERMRRMYCTKVRIGDAVEGLEKAEARLTTTVPEPVNYWW